MKTTTAGPYLSTNQPSIGTSHVSNRTNRVKAIWMAARSQPKAFWIPGTKNVQPYCRFAIITMQMTPKISWPQRSQAEAIGRADACVVVDIVPPKVFFVGLVAILQRSWLWDFGRSSRRRVMIDKLEFLIALAREKNFGKAAEQCGVTQPTFSAGIKQLEDTLGVMLVQRTSRFLGFTAEGERVLDWARTIVADCRAMREELRTLKQGLSGHLRIAAIPTALAMVSTLTTPYRAKHPNVKFTILSRTSSEVLSMLGNLEVDAGLTYIDNEPLGRLRAVPLYLEQYRLLTSADSPLGERDKVTWAEVGRIPLCLLTPDMQNRRIIDSLLHAAGGHIEPTLESNSMIVLFSHVRTGRWASVMPEKLADTLGLTERLRAIPIVEPEAVHEIGLVVPPREPMTPLVSALVAEATRLANTKG